MASSPSLAPDPTPFLDPEQRPGLPVGMSLDLIRIPVVLAVKQRVRPKKAAEDTPAAVPAEGRPALAKEFTHATVTLVERGVRRVVVVEGSPTLGLPYGDDADVLLALFRLVHDDQQRVLLGARRRWSTASFSRPACR